MNLDEIFEGQPVFSAEVPQEVEIDTGSPTMEIPEGLLVVGAFTDRVDFTDLMDGLSGQDDKFAPKNWVNAA